MASPVEESSPLLELASADASSIEEASPLPEPASSDADVQRRAEVEVETVNQPGLVEAQVPVKSNPTICSPTEDDGVRFMTFVGSTVPETANPTRNERRTMVTGQNGVETQESDEGRGATEETTPFPVQDTNDPGPAFRLSSMGSTQLLQDIQRKLLDHDQFIKANQEEIKKLKTRNTTLENQLRQAQEALRIALEKLEASDKELQAALKKLEANDEELQTLRKENLENTEKLQVKDRELQAAQEELRAKDEELQTLRLEHTEKLRAKDGELQAKDGELRAKDGELQAAQEKLEACKAEVTKRQTSVDTLLKALEESQRKAEKLKEKWKRAVEPRGAHPSRPRPVQEEEQPDCVEDTSRSSLKFGQQLGSGGFGTVYEGQWRFKGNSYHVAIKELKDVNNDTRAKLKQYLLQGEGTLMFKMDHKNVVRFYCVCTEENELRLFSEFAPLGTLLSHLKQNKEKLGARTILTFILQIAEGMAYLEEKRMVHGVLAARNVLLFSDSLIKITDFGLARLIEAGKGLCEAVTEEGETQCTARGGGFPVCCMAPESLQKTTYTHKSDVWSYGVTVWEVLTFGAQPYEEKQPKEILPFLESGSRLVQPVTCSPDLYSILMECWSLHPDARPSFAQVVKRLSVKLQDPPSFIFTMVDGVLSNYDDLPSNCGSPHNYFYMYLGHEHVCTKVKEPHDRPDHPGPDAQPRGGHTSACLSPTSDNETPPDAN